MDYIIPILTAVISAASAIIVCLINNHHTIQKALDAQKLDFAQLFAQQQQHIAVLEVKIDTLSERVEKHNSVVERTYDLEKLATEYGALFKGLEKRVDHIEKE